MPCQENVGKQLSELRKKKHCVRLVITECLTFLCSYIVIWVLGIVCSVHAAIIVVNVIIISMSFAMHTIYWLFASMHSSWPSIQAVLQNSRRCAQLHRSECIKTGKENRTQSENVWKKSNNQECCTRVHRIRRLAFDRVPCRDRLLAFAWKCKINSTDKTTCDRQLLSRLFSKLILCEWFYGRLATANGHIASISAHCIGSIHTLGHHNQFRYCVSTLQLHLMHTLFAFIWV